MLIFRVLNIQIETHSSRSYIAKSFEREAQLGQCSADFCFLGMFWNEMNPVNKNRAHRGFMDFAKRIGLVAAFGKYGWSDLLPTTFDQI
jgi:hypothetical protein